jgi:hypothetical protein
MPKGAAVPGRGAEGDDLPRPAKLWSPEDASARAAELVELLSELRSAAVRLRQIHAELERLTEFWGKEIDSPDHPDRALKDRLLREGGALDARLEGEVARLAAEGIEVKDLEAGLIDFYGLVNGELVFLCWRPGEEEVGFYHPLQGGFRSRRPLPDRPARASARPGQSP